jgi:tetratricopeptide (TPR) repeat protein
MGVRPAISILYYFLSLTLYGAAAVGEANIRDSTVWQASEYIWLNQFDKAAEIAQGMIESEPANPVGFFMAGAIYQTISEKYRNDSFRDDIYEYLDSAIDLCDERKESDPDNADLYFIAGASYGYRGLHKAFHGAWWGAFRDGLRCSSNLKKALQLDSTFYDAYWGLGSYHYYKTLKSRDFLWLPFISDRREEGMAEIRKAIENGFLARKIAGQSFLRIYLFESRFADMVSLADSLDRVVPDDAYTLLHYVEGLVALDSLDEAEQRLRRLKLVWKNSPYYDWIGMFEAELLLARIAYKRGDIELAERIASEIISRKDLCEQNAYFAETRDKAKSFLKTLNEYSN